MSQTYLFWAIVVFFLLSGFKSCFFNNGLTMAFIKHGPCPVLRDCLLMDVIKSIRESTHWNKRVLRIGSRGQGLDGEDKTNFLIPSLNSLLIKQTSFQICESLSLPLLKDSLIFDSLVIWTNSPKTSGKSFVNVLVGKGFLLVVPFILLVKPKSALEFLLLEIFSLKCFFPPPPPQQLAV